MTHQLLLLLYISSVVTADKTCFKESNHLFLRNMSQIKIPLIPLDCLFCQSAYQVDIQLIDEQVFGNRTIQRIKIYLKNFEIEDSTYICLIKLCPILVEYGSDSIVLNITATLFSHVFLSLTYSNHSESCSIQTRFTIFQSLTCTDKIFLHPRWNLQISGQLEIYDCRADIFQENIYQTSIQFYRRNLLTNQQLMTIKSSGKSCEYILDSTSYLSNSSSIQTNELITIVTIYPFYNLWEKTIQTLGPCRTELIPYQEMVFTDDIVHIRNIYIEQGRSIQIRCPIDGTREYLKYTWYYQRYQPKYQVSNNRTILLNNITEHMQGKYMCIGDDGNEIMEFEITIHVLDKQKSNHNSFHPIVMIILLIILVLFCLTLSLLLCYSLRKSSSKNSSIQKSNSVTIHHDVMVTIQHSSEQQTMNSLWDQTPYHTLDYIDDQPIYHIPSKQITQLPSWSWTNESNPEIGHEQIPYRFSARHRNINGQPPTQLTMNIPSHSDMTLSPLVKFNPINEQFNDIEILKISVPLLNQYPVIKSSSSIISFDSQMELEQFNQMTFICIDNDSRLVDRQASNNSEYQNKLNS